MAVNSQGIIVEKKSALSEIENPQERLPYWARSSNPIVRRHLGLYWRTVPPELEPFLSIYAVWIVVMLAGMIFPALFGFTMISFLASIMIMPFTLVLYAHILINIAVDSARTMQQEFTNETFELLQATPMSLGQIFLGKVAAAIWKRMDDLIMAAQLTLAFVPPVVFYWYSQIWDPNEYGYVITPVVALIGTLIILARMVLEPMMIGVLSVFVGIVVSGKGRAVSAAVVIVSFYYLLLTLLSQLPSVRGFETSDGIVPPNIPLVIFVDFVLPLAVPILLIWGLLKFSEYIVTKD